MSQFVFKIASITLSLLCLIFPLSLAAKSPQIAYINSYHVGYGWSDSLASKFEKSMQGLGANLHFYHMDSKRIHSPGQIAKRAKEIVAAIEDLQPDLIVAADDNASKYVIQPYFKNSNTPVVFLGVNIDPHRYGYPYRNATGVIEPSDSLRFVKLRDNFFAGMPLRFVFSTSTTGKRKQEALHAEVGSRFPIETVASIEEVQRILDEVAGENGMVFFDNLASIDGYDAIALRRLAAAHRNALIVTASVTNQSFCHLTYENSADEQAWLAAAMAKQILAATAPVNIPIAHGKRSEFLINRSLFAETGREIPRALLQIPHKAAGRAADG